jgi:hypothetical protein
MVNVWQNKIIIKKYNNNTKREGEKNSGLLAGVNEVSIHPTLEWVCPKTKTKNRRTFAFA